MTLDYITKIIPKRMQELGYGANYQMRMRTLSVPAQGQTQISAWNSWLYFPLEYLNRNYSLSVESDVGYLDLFSGASRSQEFEHTGKVILRNPSSRLMQCSFVALTPHCSSIHLQINQ